MKYHNYLYFVLTKLLTNWFNNCTSARFHCDNDLTINYMNLSEMRLANEALAKHLF